MATVKTKRDRRLFIVIQQGGASTEMYAHLIVGQKQVARYRRSADRAAYNTSDGILVEIPAEIEALIKAAPFRERKNLREKLERLVFQAADASASAAASLVL